MSAQFIFDCFPNAISNFGIIGCTLATAYVGAMLAFLLALATHKRTPANKAPMVRHYAGKHSATRAPGIR